MPPTAPKPRCSTVEAARLHTDAHMHILSPVIKHIAKSGPKGGLTCENSWKAAVPRSRSAISVPAGGWEAGYRVHGTVLAMQGWIF